MVLVMADVRARMLRPYDLFDLFIHFNRLLIMYSLFLAKWSRAKPDM